jgi:pyruvate/2-oxoacid:ferredoxin oxidoreductase beta subunit
LVRKPLEIDYSAKYNCDGNGRTNIMRTLTQLIALVGLDEEGLIVMMSSSVAGSLPLYSYSQLM